jgi:hypothetical protein
MSAYTPGDLEKAVFGEEIPGHKYDREAIELDLLSQAALPPELKIDPLCQLATLLVGDGKDAQALDTIHHALLAGIRTRLPEHVGKAFIVGWPLAAFMAKRRSGSESAEVMQTLRAIMTTLGEESKRFGQASTMGQFLRWCYHAFGLVSTMEAIRSIQHASSRDKGGFPAKAAAQKAREWADKMEAQAHKLDQAKVSSFNTGFRDWVSRCRRQLDL